MKKDFHGRSVLNTRKKHFAEHGARLIKPANEDKLTVRFLSAFIIAALLMPLIFSGQAKAASAQSASIINQFSLPVSAPAEPFIFPSSTSGSLSGSLTKTTLSAAIALNSGLISGYESVAEIFTTPTLPEGFAMAKVPTSWERNSTLLASSVSSVTAFAAPLLFIFSKSSSAAAAKEKTNESGSAGEETTVAETAIESTLEPNAPAAPLVLPPGTTRFDFDGDGKADASRWQPSTGEWRIKQSSGGIAISTLGASAATPAPGNYDGDAKTDTAIFDSANGIWTIKRSSNGTTLTINGFGQWGDKAAAGDYDGDGLADAAFWRPSNGTWYVKQSSNGTVASVAFGASGDIPVAGNYDGDSKMDYAVFRPSTGVWHLLLSGSGYAYTAYQWGAGSDTPVPADYDGDGKTDMAVYRPQNGTWYAYQSSTNNGAYLAKAWGNYGDQPAPADYDGDGKDDFAVWRPTTGVWYLVKSSDATFNTYAYEQLGQAGDVAAPSAYVKQIGGQVASYGLAKARLAPKNATGGTDLYSRNFSWGTSLVGLAGRAGLDAGFGISYNSLVWTKQYGVMLFDADRSNVSPGFRFGFPTIEANYLDSQTGRFAYLMVTPTGKRIEFRQEAASNIYETADSSYAQLTFAARLLGEQGQPPPVEDTTLTVTTTDGSRMTYVWKAGAFRCSEIRDRNGNFITVNHDDYGLLRTVIDTLGRTITVNYDSQQSPTSITQTWKDNNGAGANVTHTYATFTYSDTVTYTTPAINTNFVEPSTAAAIPVFGPPNGTSLKVLQKITFADNASTTFEYNGYGQVSKINNYASDNHLLNSVRTDLQNAGNAAQADCPRFSETRTYVENFNGGAETVVRNTFSENQSFSVGGASGTATKVEVSMDNAPHDVKSRTWYYPAGNWAEGLSFATEDFGDNARKRWTTTAWTQDDTSLTYMLNPRVTETKVGDEANVKKTTIDYLLQPNTNISIYGLTSEIKLYDGTLGTLLKRATTDYNLNAAYTSRRIIGLPSESRLYDGIGSLMAKTTYAYDGDSFSDSALEQNISSVIQHDNTAYGASFVTGRGNLTSTTRHDVINSSTISSQVKYNTAGAAVAQITPGSQTATTRTVKISYADSFNDTTTSRNTYAYPTKIIDAANNFSEVKYRFDTGANVWAKSPAPQNQTYGKTTTRVFDNYGRLQKESLWKDIQGTLQEFSYTRYDYLQSDRDIHSKVYSTVVDTNGNGIGDVADEVLTENWTDGAGRTRASRAEFPGSLGGYSGNLVEYDILGQVKRSSIPTEINGNWVPTGDDAAGWLWTSQEYDWKGRPTRTVNTDGTDTLVSYDGCGCAGGQVTTIQSELVPRDDQPGTTARRTQKIYADILGRNYKTEILDWNGIVYKTNLNFYNGRDQVIASREIAGIETSNDYRETTMIYDGYGRLHSQHTPGQDANKFTGYTYFADDKPEKITDARGAAKHYVYNNLGLIQQISWSRPANSDIELPAAVTFNYDNVGNRIQMSDGFGSVNYEYNSLSQLTAETRQFNETIPAAPQLNNSFKIQYAYDLGGQLKSLTEPYGEIVSYGHDKTGRLKSVSGNRTVENTQLNYVTDAKYRAWGAVKKIEYGNNAKVEMNYNNRLQAADYKLTNDVGSVFDSQIYQYYSDGRLKYSSHTPSNNDIFNRSYEYDFLGRLTAAKTGAEANGQVENNPNARPYRVTLGYNQFGDIVNQQRLNWAASFSSTFQYQNQRMTSETETNSIPGWLAQTTTTNKTHDADGRPIDDMRYNADGHISYLTKKEQEAISGHDGDYYEWNGTALKYDGDGRVIKTIKDGTRYYGSVIAGERRIFRIHSSVVGEDINKLEMDWDQYSGYNSGVYKKDHRYVYANGKEIAERRIYAGAAYPSPYDDTVIKTSDAGGVSKTEMFSGGTNGEIVARTTTLDPFGADVGWSDRYPPTPAGGYPDPNDPNCVWHDYDDFDCELPDEYDEANADDQQAGSIPDNTCYVNGVEADCNEVAARPDNYESDDVGLGGDGEYREKNAPSDEGAQGVWDDDDQSYRPEEEQESGERSFEQQYSGMSVSFNAGALSVNVQAPSPHLSTWDLRYATSLVDDKGEPKLGKGVPENLKDLVLGLAGEGKCGEVFEQLVKTSSNRYKKWKERSQNSKSIVETMYDSLKSVKINPNRGAEGTNVGGKVEVGDYNNDPRGLIFGWRKFALITLQETIHQVFTDRELLNASLILYNSGNLDPSIKNEVDVMKQSNNGKLYEHNILSAACVKSDAEILDSWNKIQWNMPRFSDPDWNLP